MLMLQNKEKIEYEGVICEMNSSYVFVSIMQKSACADCHAKGMCSISDSKEKIIEIPAVTEKYRIGDTVLVTGSFSMGLMAVLYAFIIPLLLILCFLVSGVYFTGSEIYGALFALISLSIYYCILYFFRKRFKEKFVFTLTKKL